MENKNSVDDLKTLRNWILGIIGFATTVSAVLVQALHFRPEPTIIAVAGFACALVLIVILIQRSENRQRKLVEEHIVEANKSTQGLKERLDNIDDVLLDIQKSTLRTELNDQIRYNSQNHDTILKIAEKYFCVLKADWYETNLFLDWAEKENVKLPKELKLEREE